jgi:hypothetical protein
MNEIQIIRLQLAKERLHFSEVAQACSASLGSGRLVPGSDFATACADYFAWALGRLDGGPSEPAIQAPDAHAPTELWSEFLPAFTARSRVHFEALDALGARNPLVTEWRAVSRIDADSIFAERARYDRFRATLP